MGSNRKYKGTKVLEHYFGGKILSCPVQLQCGRHLREENGGNKAGMRVCGQNPGACNVVPVVLSLELVAK